MASDETQDGHKKLSELSATAICGNDITSSCLYVSALAIGAAGRLAPLSLLIVAAVLFLFRKIYAEVVGALPLNGGAYNALLNTTSKFKASIAACLTILSYMATAVISAIEAVHYSHELWAAIPVMEATIGLLAVFTALTLLGISESARVAVVIFLTHLATLVLLLLLGLLFLARDGATTFTTNWSIDLPDGRGWVTALFFGFCAAMLGISGFESSSNFVEEQQEGVFPKTLRNMWIAVSVFNPTIALLALALIPLDGVKPETLLADMGQTAGGSFLHHLICIDATLVLSGAVLTSFIGVNGLVRRMTLDRCLPQFLLQKNRFGITYRIPIAFFLLTASVLWITHSMSGGKEDLQLEALAGVYTLSFLAVMALFALGNMLLKLRRDRLPRPVHAPWPYAIVAMAAVVAAVLGNVLAHPDYFGVFLWYFVPTLVVVMVMLWRLGILKSYLGIIRHFSNWLLRVLNTTSKSIEAKIDEINSHHVVFFTRGDKVDNLRLAVEYVLQNEATNKLKVVTVVEDLENIPRRIGKLEEDLKVLDQAYPEITLQFVVEPGTFGPALIEKLSLKYRIPTNLMFIGSHGEKFKYDQAKLGGVRLII